MWPGVSEPVAGAHLRVLSLGAGVQSTTLALMAAHGEIGPMPDAAIFADTGWEPALVMEHLHWLKGANVLPFPIHHVQAIDLKAAIAARAAGDQGRYVSIPYFLANGGMGRRQCTNEAKIVPVRREIRRLLGLRPRQHATRFKVEQWIGFSTDEMQRMAVSRDKWITNRFPLIEQRMSRGDCHAWLDRHGYPCPPKSACIGCPYRSDHRWKDMRDHDPASFAEAVRQDHALRARGTNGAMRHQEYMHRSCVPLSEVDFDARTGGAQSSFLDQCGGVCGT